MNTTIVKCVVLISLENANGGFIGLDQTMLQFGSGGGWRFGCFEFRDPQHSG